MRKMKLAGYVFLANLVMILLGRLEQVIGVELFLLQALKKVVGMDMP
jgi:hypothetical protein